MICDNQKYLYMMINIIIIQYCDMQVYSYVWKILTHCKHVAFGWEICY